MFCGGAGVFSSRKYVVGVGTKPALVGSSLSGEKQC